VRLAGIMQACGVRVFKCWGGAHACQWQSNTAASRASCHVQLLSANNELPNFKDTPSLRDSEGHAGACCSGRL
jgi:hypothetical protein